MNDFDWTAFLFAVVASGVLSSIVTSLAMRRKTTAEVRATAAQADATISQEAREWAKLWAADAEKFQQRAAHAEAKADKAEKQVVELKGQVDRLVSRVQQLERELDRRDGLYPEDH